MIAAMFQICLEVFQRKYNCQTCRCWRLWKLQLEAVRILKRGRNRNVLEGMGGSKTSVCGLSKAEFTRYRLVMMIIFQAGTINTVAALGKLVIQSSEKTKNLLTM